MAEICAVCGLPKELCVCEEMAKEQQRIKIYCGKRRYDKVVTIVEGIQASAININDLARKLKTKCAAGGTVKDGKIELQGDHRKKVQETLQEMGYAVDVSNTLI